MSRDADYPIPNAPMMPIAKAERMATVRAQRAFTYAAVIFAALGFGAGVAFGETIQIGGVHINGIETLGTSVTLAPSALPGVLAVVTMENRHVNDGGDTGVYPLVMDDLAIEVQFTWDADPLLGSDRITVTPPLGVTCDPEDCGVTVMEGFTGSITLFDWRGF